MKRRRTEVAKNVRALRSPPACEKSNLAPPGAAAGDHDAEPPASTDVAREGIRLGFLLHDVSRLRRSAYDQLMKPLAVTRSQWWVLAHLSRHDGMTQTQLADVLDIGKASLGDVLEDLERGGWIERRCDPSDKRAKRVYLAKPARGLIARMSILEDAFNAQILKDLSTSERAALLRSLSKIKHAIARFRTIQDVTVAET